MNIKVHLNWKDYNSKGELISETEKEANSLVKAFIQALLLGMLNQTISLTIKDTGGTNRTTSNAVMNVKDAGVGNVNYGILVGTGTNTVAIDDYTLQTKIAHGSSAGQLNYSAMSLDNTITTAGSTIYFNLSRTFTNNSGSDITIQEVGLVYSAGYYYLIDRTLSSKTITNGNSSTCTYRISISV